MRNQMAEESPDPGFWRTVMLTRIQGVTRRGLDAENRVSHSDLDQKIDHTYVLPSPDRPRATFLNFLADVIDFEHFFPR